MKVKMIKKYVYHIFMTVVAFLMIYPLVWMVLSSFKPESQIMLVTEGLIPREWTLEHFIRGWGGDRRISFATYFKNSFFLSTVKSITVTLTATLVAYGFARIKFKGRTFWFSVMISTMALPTMLFTVPKYLMFNEIGWIGTYLPILVPGLFGNAGNTFMLMQFMKTVPKEMDEAAEIDGCGIFGRCWRIMIPLIKPCVLMCFVRNFLGAWGDYFGALIYLNKPDMYPVAYALKLFESDTGVEYGPSLAMGTLSLVPVFIIFAIFQKQLVEGIHLSGIKG